MHGHKVKAYRADNSRFDSEDFQDHCKMERQKCTYCGVGARHQNGIGEANIKRTTCASRSLLLHATKLWPKVIKLALWPYALKAAMHQHNHLNLNSNGKSPIEVLSGTEEEIDVKDYYTWGCPVFVLDSRN